MKDNITILFKLPSEAYVGLTLDERAVYSINKLVNYYMLEENCTEEQARKKIVELSTAISKMQGLTPILMYEGR